jgi:hypothetical protein
VLPRSALILTVLVGSQPAQAHDIYSHLKDRFGQSCCSDRDCRPAPYRFTSGKLRMLVGGLWIEVPSEQVQYRALPGDTGETGGGHWCGMAYEPSVSALYMTRCAILPPQSGSTQYDMR